MSPDIYALEHRVQMLFAHLMEDHGMSEKQLTHMIDESHVFLTGCDPEGDCPYDVSTTHALMKKLLYPPTKLRMIHVKEEGSEEA